jgi:hypothetical protein
VILRSTLLAMLATLAVLGTAVTAVAAVPAGNAAPAESQIVKDAEWATRVASLVVEASAKRYIEQSSRAEFSVGSILKGSIASESLLVDLSKAPIGRWPQEGKAAILCLIDGEEEGYALASHHASIIPSTDATKGELGLLMNPPVDRLSVDPRIDGALGTGGEEPRPSVEDAASRNPYARLGRECDTVLVGSVSNMRELDDERFSARASFGVAEALLGYGAYAHPLDIYLPPVQDGEPAPVAGWAVGFFTELPTGKGLLALKLVRLLGGQEGEGLKKLAREAIGERGGEFTTVGVTLSAWAAAWNKQDLDACVRCYSMNSLLRTKYDRGGPSRDELARQLRAFPGTVRVTLHAIDVAGGADQRLAPGARADVSTTVEIAAWGETNRKQAAMKFIRENGEWLILEEDL